MRNLKNFITKAVLVFMVFFVHCVSAFAQPTDPGCDPLDPACPIDGGLSLLIAAGIGIGAKKAYDLKRKEASKS